MARRNGKPDPLTHDFFFRGRVTIFQHRSGYRFAVDAPILADFLPCSQGPVLEVGTGSGVVSLLALHLGKFPAVTALELQTRLAKLALLNAEKNGFSGRIRVMAGDFNEVYTEFPDQDLVFANPPFAKTGMGRLSRSEEIRLARFELVLTLAQVIEHAAAILAPGGRLCLIFSAQRLEEVRAIGDAAGLQVSRLRLVQPFSGAHADRVLAEWRKGETECVELPPLVIFREKGIYTPEMEAIFAGRPFFSRRDDG